VTLPGKAGRGLGAHRPHRIEKPATPWLRER
jgi:hypothetical protein